MPYQQGESYQDLLHLRAKILRDGLPPFTAEQLQDEKDDIHVGMYRLESTEVIGCCLIRRVGAWCQMRQVAIDHKEQGNGYGRMLITYFENYARSVGIDKLYIEARESAVPFYIHNGYQAVLGTFVNDGSGLVNVRLEKWM